MTRAAAFKLSDVQRAVKAAKAAGLRISAVEITPDGTIRILTGTTAAKRQEDPAVVAWETKHGLRTDPFEQWEAEQDRVAAAATRGKSNR